MTAGTFPKGHTDRKQTPSLTTSTATTTISSDAHLCSWPPYSFCLFVCLFVPFSDHLSQTKGAILMGLNQNTPGVTWGVTP